MSLIWADGFENDTLWSRKYTLTGTVKPTTTTSRTNSGNCALLTGGTTPGQIARIFPAADGHATLIIGFAVLSTSATNWPLNISTCLLRLSGDAGATPHLSVIFNGTELEVVRNSSNTAGTIIGTTGGFSPAASVWSYLEFKVVLHDSTGAVTIRQNGTTILNLTGVDTKNGGTVATFDYFRIGARNTTSGTPNLNVDDLYVLTGAGSVYNDFLGDVRLETLRPSGNGNSSQFVGSDADSTDNYLLVDESTYSNSDYVGASTSGYKDKYVYGDLVRTTGNVKGVLVQSVMAKSDSGTRQARALARTAATDYPGSSITLNTSDLVYQQPYEQNPNTAADWTISGVNGAEFGVEVV